MRNIVRVNMCWMSVLILVFGIGTAGNAQDPTFEMHMDSGNVFGGDTFTQTAKLNVLAPADIQGWSLSLCNDDAMIAVGAQLGSDASTVKNGSLPDFETTILSADAVMSGVVICFTGCAVLSMVQDFELLDVNYQVLGAAAHGVEDQVQRLELVGVQEDLHGGESLELRLEVPPQDRCAAFVVAEEGAERERRLADVAGHFIRFTLTHTMTGKGGRLAIVCEDSGSGFDFSRAPPEAGDERRYSGRGLLLIQKIGRSLNYREHGTKAEIVYDWYFSEVAGREGSTTQQPGGWS